MKKIFFLLITITNFIFTMGHYASINKIINNSEDSSIISIGKDEKIIIWNLEKYEIESQFELNKGTLYRGVFMEEKNSILTSSIEGILYLFSLNTNTLVDVKNPNIGNLENIYSLENEKFLMISKSGIINLYDYKSDRNLKQIKLKNTVSSSYFYNNYLYFSCNDYSIQRLNLENFKLDNIYNSSTLINNLIVEENILYASNTDGDIIAYDIQHKILLFNHIISRNHFINSIYLWKNFLISGLSNGEIHIYNINNNEKLDTIQVEESEINDIFVKEKIMLIAYKNGTLSFFDLNTFTLISSKTSF